MEQMVQCLGQSRYRRSKLCFPVRRNSYSGLRPDENPQGRRATLTRLITMPLPPLLLKDWGMEAAHPKIRLNIPEDAATTPGSNPGMTSPDVNLGFGAATTGSENPGGMKAPPPGTVPCQHSATSQNRRRRR